MQLAYFHYVPQRVLGASPRHFRKVGQIAASHGITLRPLGGVNMTTYTVEYARWELPAADVRAKALARIMPPQTHSPRAPAPRARAREFKAWQAGRPMRRQRVSQHTATEGSGAVGRSHT